MDTSPLFRILVKNLNGDQAGGVAFYIKEGIEYEPIETSINIECQLIKVKYDHDLVKVFCVIYRPDTFRLTKFSPKFEELLFFLKSLSYEIFIFGDFNINTLITDKDKVNYGNLLNSYDCKIQNTLPTRVTPTTKSCLDHWIASDELYTQTIETTISDHFTVAASIPLTSRKSYKKIWKRKRSEK